MKKIGFILLICVMLCGCAAAPTFETLGDVLHQQTGAMVPAKICLQLPEDAVSMGNSFFCDGFYLELQTLAAGDLNATVQAVSGFSADDLMVMTATRNGSERYEWVWSAVGEEGEVVCRAAVIDDGSYHYCLTAIAPAGMGGTLADDWSTLFSTFGIS